MDSEKKAVEPRALGTGAVLGVLSLAASFLCLGLTSIACSRILGPDGAGLIALSEQAMLIAIFVAGVGLRTSTSEAIGGGRWSVRWAVRAVLPAAAVLGIVGGAVGMGIWMLAKDGALDDFSLPMMASLMGALPFALAWWIVPAVALGSDRYEQYALLTVGVPAGILLLSPALAAIVGDAGAVYGLAGGYVLGGGAAAAWAVHVARRPESAEGPRRSLTEATSLGMRTFVNDLFQIINLRPDLFILSAYATVADTGVYAVALSITSFGFVLPQSLATVVLPRSAAQRGPQSSWDTSLAEGTAASAVRHSVLVSAATVIALAAGLFLVPPLWGGEFEKTIEYGFVMLPGILLLGVGRVMVASFTGLGHANHALIVGLVSFPATVIAYLLVIPDHGPTGAAIVSSASYVAAALLAAVLFFRSVPRIRESLIPRWADIRDYIELAQKLRGAVTEAWRQRREVA